MAMQESYQRMQCETINRSKTPAWSILKTPLVDLWWRKLRKSLI